MMGDHISRKKKVVILGGGFGGVYCARYLQRYAADQLDIVLINQTNYFVFQPLLPEVVAGTINAADAVTSLRLLLPNVSVRMAEVSDVDFESRCVHILQGSKRIPQQLHYDQLVLAFGQKTDLSRLPGFEEHSHSLRNVADAHGLRNHIIQCLEHADITADDELKRRLLTFVVAGGGFSGVETIGELMQMVRRALRHYPNIKQSQVSFVLVQRGRRILPELPEKLAAYAHEKLLRRGAKVLLQASLQAATGTAVLLVGGQRIATSTLVTTVGNGPTELVKKLQLSLNHGKIATDSSLRAVGYDNVWALGDAALIRQGGSDSDTSSTAPPTAQFAVKEGKCVAANICASIDGRALRDFSYTPKGALASLGDYQGVAEIFGLRLSGLFAWALWRGIYISMLPSFSTKLRIALNWLFDYFLPRNIVQISNSERSSTQYIYFSRGDVVYKPGQHIDGFYVVVAGSLESRVYDEAIQEDFVRQLLPGDHWGERSLIANETTMGTLVAMEDSRVLVFKRGDFRNLCAAFPVFDSYFKDIPERTYPRVLRGRDGGNSSVQASLATGNHAQFTAGDLAPSSPQR